LEPIKSPTTVYFNKKSQKIVFSFLKPNQSLKHVIKAVWFENCIFEPIKSPTTVYFNKKSQKIVFSFLKPNQTLKHIIKAVWFSIKYRRKILSLSIFLASDPDVHVSTVF
jgi:hypothetical protein